MATSYVLELHALKAELQSTLARLGIDSSPLCDEAESQLPIDVLFTPETAETAAESTETCLHVRYSTVNGPRRRWSRRRLVQELAAASQRRRQLETQLQQEMESDRHQQQVSNDDNRRRGAWQAAIAELQHQRAEIQGQMEAEMAESVDQEQEQEQEENADRRQTAIGNNEFETHYSIGGVVTLEPLASFQQVPGLVNAESGLSVRRTVATAPSTAAPAAPAVSSMLDSFTRYRNQPDALNDVFSMQLKFAETMLKLEKSVQMRDQLLHHGGAMSKRHITTRSTREDVQTRRRRARKSSQHRQPFETSSNSDSSIIYREAHESESFSSSAYSFSSLDSTPRHGEPIRVRYPNFGVSRATTAETLAPSSSSAIHAPGLDTTGGAAPVSSAPISSPRESPNTQCDTSDNAVNFDVRSQLTEEQHDEAHRTPTTGSSVTTPTTGSDQKSNTSSKQVRFGDDAYSTPVLARKFNFDNPSIDEDDYDEKTEDEASLLSFLGGSSVTSAELNDASFLRAFQRFRRELQVSRQNSGPQWPNVTRELFPASEMELPSLTRDDGGGQIDLPISDEATVDTATLNASTQPSRSPMECQDQTVTFPQLAQLSVQELQERRRQLCLDIQAASAQLVLNFGAMQSGSQDTEQTKGGLLALRDELKAVETRISEMQ